ncbi:IS3 family transposase [Corynebacterium casei]|uniref:IS3 family transposase n=1 Tax=Corynebacterium casei TaxID=160386 RepID=UPI003FD4D36D
MCTVLNLTRSSFYKWKATHTPRVARTCADDVLGARIAAVSEEENSLYGAKRITASLNEAKEFARINHKKVARIMKT